MGRRRPRCTVFHPGRVRLDDPVTPQRSPTGSPVPAERPVDRVDRGGAAEPADRFGDEDAFPAADHDAHGVLARLIPGHDAAEREGQRPDGGDPADFRDRVQCADVLVCDRSPTWVIAPVNPVVMVVGSVVL